MILAHLVRQVLPLYLERLSLNHLGHRDHQELLDLLEYQEEMGTREAKAIKEIQAKKGLKDF